MKASKNEKDKNRVFNVKLWFSNLCHKTIARVQVGLAKLELAAVW